MEQTAHAIRELLIPIRARLDQLVKQAEDEDVNISRDTTEQLLEQLGSLHTLEVEADKLGNKRLLGEVHKERDRARQGLGLLPRKRKR